MTCDDATKQHDSDFGTTRLMILSVSFALQFPHEPRVCNCVRVSSWRASQVERARKLSTPKSWMAMTHDEVNASVAELVKDGVVFPQSFQWKWLEKEAVRHIQSARSHP